MAKDKKKIAIIGGGLAGLTYANLSNDDCTIFEKEDKVGGLCRSFTTQGVLHDIGPHICFSKNKKVLDWVNNIVPMRTLKRSNHCLYKGERVKYPFENGIAKFSNKDKFIDSFFSDKYADYETENLLQYFLKTYGEEITKEYLEPYNRKIWKFDPAFMNTIMVDRLPEPDHNAILNGDEGHLHQLNFEYPVQGGMQSIINGLAIKPRILLNSRIEMILERRNNTFCIYDHNYGYLYFDEIISTIPPQEIIPLINVFPGTYVNEALDSLKYNSIHISIVKYMPSAQLGVDLATYIADSDIPFHRATNLTFFDIGTTEKAMMVETTFNKGDMYDLSEEDISKLIYDSLINRNLFQAKDIQIVESRAFKYAYVVYDLHYEKNLAIVKDFMDKVGIHMLGRFGSFKYLNMDGVVEQAMERVKAHS